MAINLYVKNGEVLDGGGELEIVKIEKLRCSETCAEWCITLHNGSFIVLKRPWNETVMELCRQIGELKKISVMELRTLDKLAGYKNNN